MANTTVPVRNHFWQGMFIGGAMGLVAGLFAAPKAGREFRDELSLRADNYVHDAKDKWTGIKEKMTTVAAELKDVLSAQAEQMNENLGGKSDTVKQRVSAIRERIARTAEEVEKKAAMIKEKLAEEKHGKEQPGESEEKMRDAG